MKTYNLDQNERLTNLKINSKNTVFEKYDIFVATSKREKFFAVKRENHKQLNVTFLNLLSNSVAKLLVKDKSSNIDFLDVEN